jgi:hypothetical protein
MDYFLLNSFTSVAEILDDFPHPRVSQWPPQSTLRAVAHRCGSGCHGVWCRCLALLVLEFGIVVIRLWCTCHPPNEQLLVGMAVGALSSVICCSHGGGRVGTWSCSLLLRGPCACSSLSSVPAVIHLPYPTCKQVLAVVGMGGGLALSRWGGLSASM